MPSDVSPESKAEAGLSTKLISQQQQGLDLSQLQDHQLHHQQFLEQQPLAPFSSEAHAYTSHDQTSSSRSTHKGTTSSRSNGGAALSRMVSSNSNNNSSSSSSSWSPYSPPSPSSSLAWIQTLLDPATTPPPSAAQLSTTLNRIIDLLNPNRHGFDPVKHDPDKHNDWQQPSSLPMHSMQDNKQQQQQQHWRRQEEQQQQDQQQQQHWRWRQERRQLQRLMWQLPLCYAAHVPALPLDDVRSFLWRWSSLPRAPPLPDVFKRALFDRLTQRRPPVDTTNHSSSSRGGDGCESSSLRQDNASALEGGASSDNSTSGSSSGLEPSSTNFHTGSSTSREFCGDSSSSSSSQPWSTLFNESFSNVVSWAKILTKYNWGVKECPEVRRGGEGQRTEGGGGDKLPRAEKWLAKLYMSHGIHGICRSWLKRKDGSVEF